MNAEHIATLRLITQEHPHASLDTVARELFRRAGMKVSTVTIRKTLRHAGIERLKPIRRADSRAAVQDTAPKRYSYTAMHRGVDGASGMNIDLTDAEWALVADLFERDGQRGAPPRFERRLMVNACCYVLRTGCSWRLAAQNLPVLASHLQSLPPLDSGRCVRDDAQPPAPTIATIARPYRQKSG
ncbi:MAG: transposase [Candidatus Accumulibacter sp.]|nr:transposase [Accumulibacter sp.]